MGAQRSHCFQKPPHAFLGLETQEVCNRGKDMNFTACDGI